MGRCLGGDAGGLYGDPRYHHRQRCPAACCRFAFRQLRRIHLGADQLSGGQWYRAAHFGVSQPRVRSQAVFPDLHRDVHRLLLLCGIATELWQIILFRVLQGFFGGGLQPTQQSVLLDYFKPEDRGKAFGLSSIAIIVAPVMGPTLGGWITDNYSWRWVFFINIPVGIVTVLAIYQLLEDPPWERKSDKKLTIDWPGIGLIALGLGCLQVMLDRGEDEDWFASDFTRIFAVLTAVGIVGAIYWLLYAKKPVVDLRCMADKNFAVSSLLMAGMAMILYGSSVVIPQLAQQDLGYTATWSGLVLSPGRY
jgi:DHA2 family multidrug resistance protein